MTEDFDLPAEWQEWAIAERPDMDCARTFAVFRDYWVANGKMMVNWRATWRNWVRRDADFARPKHAHKRGDYDAYADCDIPAF